MAQGGGEILNGQLKDGKVKYAEIVSKFRPPKAEASMWLLARRFPERWGPQAKGEAHEGKAPDRQATVIFYKLDKNGRVCDLVLPSNPHFSSEMLPWCTTPIEAESSLGPDSHHPIISVSGIPSAVMVLRILHPILASPLCAANPLARIAEPTIAL